MAKTKHFLIVDTDSYSGNFERELCSYAFGVVDEYASSSSNWTPTEEVLEEDPELEDYYSFWQEAIEWVNTEYGRMPEEMCHNQEGQYHSVRLAVGQWAWEELGDNPKYLSLLKTKLEEAASRLTYSNERDEAGHPLPIKILGLRHVEETVAETSTKLF